MGEALLAILPGALLRTLVPVVAAILVGVLARGRARRWGVWGFVVTAVATLASGLLSPLLPLLIRETEMSIAVLSGLVTVAFTLISIVSTALIVIAIVLGGRAPAGETGAWPQEPPWNLAP